MKFIYVLIEGREAEGRKAMKEQGWFISLLLFSFFIFWLFVFALLFV